MVRAVYVYMYFYVTILSNVPIARGSRNSGKTEIRVLLYYLLSIQCQFKGSVEFWPHSSARRRSFKTLYKSGTNGLHNGPLKSLHL